MNIGRTVCFTHMFNRAVTIVANIYMCARARALCTEAPVETALSPVSNLSNSAGTEFKYTQLQWQWCFVSSGRSEKISRHNPDDFILGQLFP